MKVVSGRAYHRLTAYERGRLPGHRLAWDRQPAVVKDYPGRPMVALPPVGFAVSRPLMDMCRPAAVPAPRSLNLNDIARLLRLTVSVTGRASFGGGDFHYRSVASAGALYPCEIYLLAPDGIEGLAAGIYNYRQEEGKLTALAAGDPLPAAAKLLPGADPEHPELLLAVSVIFYRTAWKYHQRANRYLLLDTGHLLENLLLGARFLDLPALLADCFAAAGFDELLAVDPEREGTLAVVRVPLPVAGEPAMEMKPVVSDAALRAASRMAAREEFDPLVAAMHRAGVDFPAVPGRGHEPGAGESPPGVWAAVEKCVVAGGAEAPGEAGIGREPIMPGDRQIRSAPNETISKIPGRAKTVPVSGVCSTGAADVSPPSGGSMEIDYPTVIGARRSRRNFVRREPLDAARYEALLMYLEAGLRTLPLPQVPDIFIVHGAVEGLAPGVARLCADGPQPVPGMADAGDLVPLLAHACLDQQWLAGAVLHVLLAADIAAVERPWGPSGYAALTLAAGMLGQWAYLAATALGLGCCGIGAFYDREVTTVTGLPENLAPLYLLAVGSCKG